MNFFAHYFLKLMICDFFKNKTVYNRKYPLEKNHLLQKPNSIPNPTKMGRQPIEGK